MAVPPAAQPDVIRRAVELGKGRLRGILAQKPLALSVRDAKDLVARCADAGIAHIAAAARTTATARRPHELPTALTACRIFVAQT